MPVGLHPDQTKKAANIAQAGCFRKANGGELCPPPLRFFEVRSIFHEPNHLLFGLVFDPAAK
jgi:hypothetical protein